GRWIEGRLGPGDAPHISIDGKTARGSRDGDAPGVHLVSAYYYSAMSKQLVRRNQFPMRELGQYKLTSN
ncbi:MAG: hypothetical protein ACM35G_03860, partial [Planctomycetaceae bacterium]